MNPVMSFASARRDRMREADSELSPLVLAALARWGGGDWFADLVEGASVLWLEMFTAEAPNADPDRFMPRFHEMLRETLEQTTEPSNPPSEAQVNRLTYWLSTATINNATYWGNSAHGGAGMRWVTMSDSSVRETHRHANGQIANADGTFDIGGFDLRYPGEPVGPPEVWINCRCILAPARVEGALSMTVVMEDAVVASGFAVEAETEEGSVTYGPFDTAENAQAWIESENGPGDGSFEVIELKDPVAVTSVQEPPPVDGPPAIIADMAGIIADVDEEVETDVESEDLPIDELEDDEEEITEIPVHGVAAVEGRATGDGRKFAVGSVSFGAMPQPLGFEFESSHDGTNSKVAVIGRIDEFFKVEADGIVEVRFRGVVFPGKEYASRAIDGIIDGSYQGLSVIVDEIALDVEALEQDELATEPGKMIPQTFSEVRIRRFDMVPTGAYQEGWLNLGHEFADEMSKEALAACAVCGEGENVFDDEMLGVDLTSLSEEELAAYDAMPMQEQNAYVNERGLIYVSTTYREVSPEERKKLAEEGNALPDGSFPIANVEDLRNAIQAIGRATDPEAVRTLIKKRARELGEEDLIPEGWDAEVETLVAAAFAPGTKDGPGWITHPVPTGRIRHYWVRGEGAAKIRWGQPGDFNRCRRQLAKYIANPEWLAGACANMHKEALGVWPGQHHSVSAEALESKGKTMNIVAAGANVATPADVFRNPKLEGPTAITIEEDRIFGHLATWNVCHIGIQDACVTAPHSSSNYAFYRTGVVATEEGRVPVGQITMGTGHASIKANAKAAVAHYDNTGSVVADVVAGEDSYGIWVAGVLRPNLSDEQVAALAASALSGDWRRTASGLELVAALAVNVPGFPVPRTALAASGMAEGDGQRIDEIEIDMDEIDAVYGLSPVERQETVTAGLLPNAEEIAGIVRTAVDEYRSAQNREERLAALSPFVDKARENSLSRVQGYFQEA